MQRAGSGWYLPFFSDLPSFLLYSLRDPYFLLSYFVLPYFLQVPQPLRQRKEDHRHVSFLRADHGDHPEPESSTHRAIRAGASCILQASLCETISEKQCSETRIPRTVENRTAPGRVVREGIHPDTRRHRSLTYTVSRSDLFQTIRMIVLLVCSFITSCVWFGSLPKLSSGIELRAQLSGILSGPYAIDSEPKLRAGK